MVIKKKDRTYPHAVGSTNNFFVCHYFQTSFFKVYFSCKSCRNLLRKLSFGNSSSQKMTAPIPNVGKMRYRTDRYVQYFLSLKLHIKSTRAHINIHTELLILIKFWIYFIKLSQFKVLRIAKNHNGMEIQALALH